MNKLINNEVDMLKGDINRMCVTDDLKELKQSYTYALKRLNSIFEYKRKVLEGENNEDLLYKIK